MGSTKCWKVESRWLRQIISKLIKFKLHDSLTDIVEWRTPKPCLVWGCREKANKKQDFWGGSVSRSIGFLMGPGSLGEPKMDWLEIWEADSFP